MNRFVAARRPARALLQSHGVIGPADQDGAAFDLLKMAFEAKVGIAHGQQFGVDATMRRVTGGAAFVQRLVFEHIRAALCLMALEAILFLRKHLRAAAGMSDALVRRMTENASHPAFGHGMMAGQFKLTANVQVTGVANGFLRARR